jgi:hypothetical protein
VYCRVARGEFVFDDDFEATEFVEVLRKVRDLDGWTVFDTVISEGCGRADTAPAS